MTYDAILTALADPTRRAILDQMRSGPKGVARIAAPLPVSRPAVSQHLKVMLAAGLVTVEKAGTRNLYGLAPSGIVVLQEWLEGLRNDARASALSRAAPTADGEMPPIEKAFDVRLSPSEAFTLFTEDLALWWPVAAHSLSALADGSLPMALVFHTGPDGRIEETQLNGSAHTWATVTQWDPPHGLDLRWSMGLREATQVQVRFEAAGRGTRMILIHGGWSALADGAEAERARHDTLWDHVLGARFTAAAHASLSNF